MGESCGLVYTVSRMRIGTFNLKDLFDEGLHRLYNLDFQYTADFVERRIEFLSKVIRKVDADILFLQEVGSEKVLARVATAADPTYSHFMGRPDKRGIANAVLFRLSNCTCTSVPAMGPLPVFVEGDADVYSSRIDVRRDFVRLDTTYAGLPLMAVGVHLKSSIGTLEKGRDGRLLDVTTQLDAADGYIRSAIFRFAQARKLREMVDACFAANKEAQVIILGDFNALERAEVLRVIYGELEDSATKLSSACNLVSERKRFSHIRHGEKRLLDHLLVSENVRRAIRSVTIFNKKLRDIGDEPLSLRIVESDHAPIVMEVQ